MSRDTMQFVRCSHEQGRRSAISLSDLNDAMCEVLSLYESADPRFDVVASAFEMIGYRAIYKSAPDGEPSK